MLQISENSKNPREFGVVLSVWDFKENSVQVLSNKKVSSQEIDSTQEATMEKPEVFLGLDLFGVLQ